MCDHETRLLQYLNENCSADCFLCISALAAKHGPTAQRCYAFLSLNDSADKFLIPEAKAGRLFIGIRGFIKYKDVFDRARVTAFPYVWKYAEGMYGLGEEQEYGDWVKRGKPEENQET